MHAREKSLENLTPGGRANARQSKHPCAAAQRGRSGPTNREIDMTKTFLTITCAAATMTAILLVSSGDALASKANRGPDRGGQVVRKSQQEQSDCRRICKVHALMPGHLYNSTKGRATSGERELNGFYLPSGHSTHFGK
jgi:hypothetical protein